MNWNVSVNKLATIEQATAEDDVLSRAMRYTLNGWPDVRAVPVEPKAFHEARNHLSVKEGLLIYDSLIAIPVTLRTEMLTRIYDGHMGIMKSRERAKSCIRWPGISQDIKTRIEHCTYCRERRPAQVKEPLICIELPDQPWERVATDLCSLKAREYLVVSDYFSRYIEIAHLRKSMTSQLVIGKLKSIFARWGIPLQLVSDNGLQFDSSEFAAFATKYGFDHIMSSPTHAQSNGEVDSAVKTAKRILEQKDPARGLLAYRYTPIATTGYSPAELLVGRKLRTTLPILPNQTNPELQAYKQARETDCATKSASERHYNTRFGCKPLPELSPGEPVRIKTDAEKRWTKPATVVKKCEIVPRSNIVETESGTTLRRNQRHLQQLPTPVATPDPSPAETPPEPATITPNTALTQTKTPIVRRSGRSIKPVEKPNL
ncbi:uncharacterized protein K02A2.6-like [Lineus longissimus]|uniref:uncharacterized protein K02A2.6-like n=1 Tax=Lineus longissimus TaxID=88925 RepID=UPI00315CBF8C